MDHSIFISYSSTDQAAADKVCAALEAAGMSCWMAPRDIEPGADYPAAILQGLQQAQIVVLVVSPAAVESPHILSEVGHAFSKRKPIIPFRITATDLPPDFDYFLSLSQWLDAREGCTPANLARLTQAVSEARKGAVSRVVRPASRRRIMVAAVLAVVVLAGMGYWLRPAPKPPVADKKDLDKLDKKDTGEKITGAVENKTGTPDKTSTPKEVKPQPWVNAKDKETYVWIPPGRFVMGCSAGDPECKPDESPSHTVEISSGFWMGQTEVTNAAYQRLVPSAKFPPDEANLPVVEISWQQAKSYCAAAGGRLPTEAEWEYAARAGNPTAYYGNPTRIAWFDDNSDGTRHPVATKQPNDFGLYDMLGNASEWVEDRYFNKYDPDAPSTGKVTEPLDSNANALTRGGFWESTRPNIRVSRRAAMENDEPAPMAGIRCIADKK